MKKHGTVSISLAEYRAKLNVFSEKMLKHFITQILKGLEYLHEKGIAHMDIKPGNIVINGELEARLIDLGESMPARDPRHHHPHTAFNGTTIYMSPEMLIDGM